ncbi:MAG TPA: tetratricopeptide repeat protein [Myxococcales bacterium]|jgi:hypothetical protein|nr:tetratricopeptide repeat protein [Myxococcales bacterium]
MTQALLLSALLALSAQPKKSGSGRLTSAQTEFNRGDFTAALRDLDAAIAETTDEQTLSRIYLLRGQCYGAQRDVVKAEESFEKALENDPEAKLDPTRVDPNLVSVLESLRERMQGDLEVRTDRPAKVSFDGKALGPAPVKSPVSIGRHRLEARTGDGRYVASSSVVIAAHKTTTVDMQLAEARREEDANPNPGGTGPREGGGREGREPPMAGGSSFQLWGGRPLADLRVGVNPFDFLAVPEAEVGFGLEWPYLRASAHLRFLPTFGVTPRGGLWVPVTDQFRAYAELELPILSSTTAGVPVAIGLGGAGGAEYFFIKWLSGFAEVGVRNFFIPSFVEVTIQAGLRLRLP